MKTHQAQTQPVSLGGQWIAISTYAEPRTFEQAFADVSTAIHQDKSPKPSPKRIVRIDGDETKVVWESQPASRTSATSKRTDK